MKNKNPFIDESAFEGDDTPKKSEDEILMEEAKQHTEVVEVKTYMSLGMVIGLGAGAVVGMFFGKMQFGGSSVDGIHHHRAVFRHRHRRFRQIKGVYRVQNHVRRKISQALSNNVHFVPADGA